MIKNIYIRTATNVITSVISVITLVLIIKIFGTEVLGRVTYYYSIAGVLGILSDLGFSTAYNKFLASEDNRRDIAAFLFFKVLLIGLYVIIFVSAYFLKFNDGRTDARLLWILFSVLMFEKIAQFFTATFIGKRDFTYMSIAEIVASIIFFVYTLFICFARLSIYALASTRVVIPAVTILWGVAYFRTKKINVFLLPSRADIRKYMSYSMPIAFSTISSNFILYADKLVLGKLMGVNEVGLYDIAHRCYAAVDKLIKPVTNTMFTEIVHRIANVQDFFHKRFQDLVQVLGFISGVLSIILIFSSTFVIATVFGIENSRSAFILKFFALSVLLRLFWRPYTNVIYSIEKHRLVSMIEPIGVLMMLGYYYLLIPLEISGVAVGAAALPIAEFIMCIIPAGVLKLFILKRHFGRLGIDKLLISVWLPLAVIIFGGYFFNYSIFMLPIALLLFVGAEFYMGILTKDRFDELMLPIRKVFPAL
ncbi:MAG: oligosaccharide flippase family protein [Sedimentisphaerales bacterium]|nr:oligosaccharide flippase family protein [Sedimentisphaerales bacterium]